MEAIIYVLLYLNKKIEESKGKNNRQEDGSREADGNNGTKNHAEGP